METRDGVAVTSPVRNPSVRNPPAIKELISKFNSSTSNGVSEHLPSQPISSASSNHSNTLPDTRFTLKVSSNPDVEDQADPVAVARTREGQEYAKLLNRQNAAILEFESELQVYEAGIHAALLKMGIERGLYGLDSMTAMGKLDFCIDMLLKSEGFLLQSLEEKNIEILEKKELEQAIMSKLSASIAKGQEPSTSKPSQASAEQSELQLNQDQCIRNLKLISEQQNEELRELYAYSTQLLERMCEVQEENARLREKQTAVSASFFIQIMRQIILFLFQPKTN
jgi:hypothetical protein